MAGNDDTPAEPVDPWAILRALAAVLAERGYVDAAGWDDAVAMSREG